MPARTHTPPAWSLWIEGISNESPGEFLTKPSRINMLAYFLKGVRERYRLKDDNKAKALAKSLDLKLALSSRKAFVIYYRLTDLEAVAELAV